MTQLSSRAARVIRDLVARFFPRTPAPPRQSDIERALLRALGGL